jgi:L-alanine-DL-glutamate epimerase-like enolase superfamily enzyme
MTRRAPVIERVTSSAYTVPTDVPEADGTLSWDSTTLVLASVHSGELTGLGWTYTDASASRLINGLLARALVGRELFDLPGAALTMRRAVRNLGRDGLASTAISAVDIALWDLKARVLELPLCALLGRTQDAVQVYGSGGFTTYSDERTREQLSGWVHDQRIPRVKIKIGESWGTATDRDLHRVATARQAIGPDAELFVDANGGYTVGQARRIEARLRDYGVTWFEEPVSSDDLSGLAAVRAHSVTDIAAGEYGYSLPYFSRMADAVDCLQVDVTRCGGISEWFRACALAAAHNLQVSAHCAPQLSAQVGIATPNIRHLEWFHDHVRIESMLFEGVLTPTDGTVAPDLGTVGHGMSLNTRMADSHLSTLD